MNDGLIPNRYAKALYKLADEKGMTAQVYAQMQLLDKACETEPGFTKAITNPFLPTPDKLRLLCVASGAESDGLVAKFMELVIKNNRIEFTRAIALAYCKQYREKNGIAKVEIATAIDMAPDEIKSILNVIQPQVEGKQVELTTRTDGSLIGGFTVSIDSQVLDASIKNQLEKLRLKLLS